MYSSKRSRSISYKSKNCSWRLVIRRRRAERNGSPEPRGPAAAAAGDRGRETSLEAASIASSIGANASTKGAGCSSSISQHARSRERHRADSWGRAARPRPFVPACGKDASEHGKDRYLETAGVLPGSP
eukprot:tig00000350_g24302.t1